MYGNNFVKQHSETAMVWNYQNADCILTNKFIVPFIKIFRHTFVPYVRSEGQGYISTLIICQGAHFLHKMHQDAELWSFLTINLGCYSIRPRHDGPTSRTLTHPSSYFLTPNIFDALPPLRRCGDGGGGIEVRCICSGVGCFMPPPYGRGH